MPLKSTWQIDLETHSTDGLAAHTSAHIAVHAADAHAHAIYATDIDTDPQTLLPPSTITNAFTALYVIHAKTADIVQCGIATLTPGESETLLQNGTDACILTVTIAGALTATAAHTDTYTLELLPIWI